MIDGFTYNCWEHDAPSFRYSEACSSTLASTYSSGSSSERKGRYLNDFRAKWKRGTLRQMQIYSVEREVEWILHYIREGGSPKLCGRHLSVPQLIEGCDDRPAPPVHLVAHGDLRLGAPRRRHRRPLPRGQPRTHLEGRPAPYCQVCVSCVGRTPLIYQKQHIKDQAITLESGL